MKSLAIFLHDYYTNPLAQKAGQRIGQYFYNIYIKKDPWPDLFYANDKKAIEIITDWLEDNQYINELPWILDHKEFESKTLEDLVREFIRLLEIREVSDNEVEFSPTKITSCRVMDLQRIQKLIEQMKARII